MARRFAKVLEEEIEEAFFYPSDLVNTLGEERRIYTLGEERRIYTLGEERRIYTLGEERRIYTSTLRVSVYIHHYSPPLREIVVYYFTFWFILS